MCAVLKKTYEENVQQWLDASKNDDDVPNAVVQFRENVDESDPVVLNGQCAV